MPLLEIPTFATLPTHHLEFQGPAGDNTGPASLQGSVQYDASLVEKDAAVTVMMSSSKQSKEGHAKVPGLCAEGRVHSPTQHFLLDLLVVDGQVMSYICAPALGQTTARIHCHTHSYLVVWMVQKGIWAAR